MLVVCRLPELVNNILTSGMVPALFAEDERDSLMGEVMSDAQATGAFSKDQVWQYFVRRCQSNLHVVLSMSPVGETLRTRCRNFPGLVNNTTIDWFTAWPEQALTIVAEVSIAENAVRLLHLQDVIAPFSYVNSLVLNPVAFTQEKWSTSDSIVVVEN
ncbi:DNAH10 [Cordylochernes scorpioides]|uniref:DNAH10 n=1 Tax=Cordylochernes scorpioides TaxID=51811 RepID=A0ABY6KCP4_9ARAC|nr:DNAH10 [Cordylochernes scorpioides]